MSAGRRTRLSFALGALLVLSLGIGGFAVGRSLRTSKAQAEVASRLAMARAYDSFFRGAYGAATPKGFARGLPEGEALGRERGAARGRRHGERLKEHRLRREAARRRALARRLARSAERVAPAVRRAPAHRRRPHQVKRHPARRPARERRQRETLGGEGREGGEERALERGEGEGEPR